MDNSGFTYKLIMRKLVLEQKINTQNTILMQICVRIENVNTIQPNSNHTKIRRLCRLYTGSAKTLFNRFVLSFPMSKIKVFVLLLKTKISGEFSKKKLLKIVMERHLGIQ